MSEQYRVEQQRPDERLAERQQAELVIASTLFLMSNYCQGNRSEHLRMIIQRHLEALTEREDLCDPLRQLCDQLSMDWANVHALKPLQRAANADLAIRSKTSPLAWFKRPRIA